MTFTLNIMAAYLLMEKSNRFSLDLSFTLFVHAQSKINRQKSVYVDAIDFFLNKKELFGT